MSFPVSLPEHVADGSQANVDEVFIDLCRQIIRRDNTATSAYNDDDHLGSGGYGHDSYVQQVPTKPRRNRRRKKSHCTIL